MIRQRQLSPATSTVSGNSFVDPGPTVRRRTSSDSRSRLVLLFVALSSVVSMHLVGPLLFLQDEQQPAHAQYHAATAARHLRFAMLLQPIEEDIEKNTANTGFPRIIFEQERRRKSSWLMTAVVAVIGPQRLLKDGRVVLPSPWMDRTDIDFSKNDTLLLVGGEEHIANYPQEVDWNRTTEAQQRLAQGQPIDCESPAWTEESYPTCNIIHETVTLPRIGASGPQELNLKRLGHGYYRTGYRMEWQRTRRRRGYWMQPPPQHEDTVVVVLKMLQHHRWFSKTQLQQINREAVLLGHYFSSSPRMANLYAHCGGSVVVEPGQNVVADLIQPDWIYVTNASATAKDANYDDDDIRGFIPQEELDKLHSKSPDGVYIHNRKQLPQPRDKLNLALPMLESIALLHSFAGGPILHDDISLDQWLVSATADGSPGRVMLNDLNNVVPLEWSPSEQAYCRPPRSLSGNFRPPEFYPKRQALGTGSDVWSMGCVLYCILTGLNPYYEHADDLNHAIIDGLLPSLHPLLSTRSAIEFTLAHLIPKMMQKDPFQRPDLITVIRQLQLASRKIPQQTVPV